LIAAFLPDWLLEVACCMGKPGIKQHIIIAWFALSLTLSPKRRQGFKAFS
jgi:hypothetical protein